jgi:ABC-type Fe3+-siderophore transport system permease subunit
MSLWLRSAFLILAIVAGVAISACGYYVVQPTIDPNAKHSLFGANSFARALILYGSMVLGIIARELHEFLGQAPEGKPGRGKKKRHWYREIWNSRGLGQALIVSPLVFFGVYKAANEQPDQVVALILAFQNGFFWKTILERQQSTQEPAKEE